MSDQYEISSPSVEDAYKFLNLVPHPDGSLTRINRFPIVPAVPEIDPDDPTAGAIALSRDIPLNPRHKTYIRLFRPRNVPAETKLPLIIYFHGGGFVLLSVKSIIFHELCNHTAAKSPALVASVEYRLTPEHRLPAAYEDAMEAINWAKTQALAAAEEDGACDPWIKELADFSKIFLMGCSAGGNIVYHAALRALALDLEPLKIVALIINQPFFGGLLRTQSEIEYGASDPVIPLHAMDLMWSLALPVGADRQHEYCDPFTIGSHRENIGLLPLSVVRAYAGDILIDRQKGFARMLAALGVHVVPQFVDGGYHAVDVIEPRFAQALHDDTAAFVRSFSIVDEGQD
ncbi:hypothetical protein OROHE_007507 [Orobanche hederae]